MIDAETRFFLAKMEFDYGKEEALEEMKKAAEKVDWLKGWPQDKAAFWNGEAFMWGCKISSGKREMIAQELKHLEGKENLDLGCGAHSYIPSVGFDVSERMLLMNENLKEKRVGDLEKELPFEEGKFDSATLVFVLDYVKNYKGLLKEAFRVLKKGGSLVVVQAAKKVDKWHRRQAVNKLSFRKVSKALGKAGFVILSYEKEGLWFFKCLK